MKKTIIALAISFLVLGGGAALLVAQGSSPAATTANSAAEISAAEAESATDLDNDNVEVQEGDQNGPDDGSSAED